MATINVLPASNGSNYLDFMGGVIDNILTYGGNSTSFSITGTGGRKITAEGSGFSYFWGIPTGGVLTRLVLETTNGSTDTELVELTGFSLSLQQLFTAASTSPEAVIALLGDISFNGNAGADIAVLGGGNDTVRGFAGSDTLSGGAGNDRLEGGAGVDSLDGGIGNDVLYGGTEGDYLYARDGNDTLYGESGDDRLFAGVGNDIAIGGAGADYIYGEVGNDGLYGEAGDDVIIGGADNDYLYGQEGLDVLYGEQGGDAMFGGADRDILYGQADGDYLYGEAGNDQLEGGAGADALTGGTGNDVLYGGADGDYFYFLGAFGQDQIGDFSRAQGDRIVFSAAEVNPQGGVGLQYYSGSNTSVFSVAGIGQVYVTGQVDFSDIVLV